MNRALTPYSFTTSTTLGAANRQHLFVDKVAPTCQNGGVAVAGESRRLAAITGAISRVGVKLAPAEMDRALFTLDAAADVDGARGSARSSTPNMARDSTTSPRNILPDGLST